MIINTDEPGPFRPCVIDATQLQRRFIIETIFAALAEIEQSPDFSQGVADDMCEVLKILGVKSDEIEEELSR